MCPNLVEIFPGKECLILLFVQVDGQGHGLGTFLPQRTGAVSRQGVVPHLVVVRVLPRQNAAPAGAAQRRHCELYRTEKKDRGGQNKCNVLFYLVN